MLYLVFVTVFLILWGCFYAALPALRHASAVSALARLTVRYARIGRFTTRVKAYVPIALVVIIGGLVAAWAGDQSQRPRDGIDRGPRRAELSRVPHRDAMALEIGVSRPRVGRSSVRRVRMLRTVRVSGS